MNRAFFSPLLLLFSFAMIIFNAYNFNSFDYSYIYQKLLLKDEELYLYANSYIADSLKKNCNNSHIVNLSFNDICSLANGISCISSFSKKDYTDKNVFRVDLNTVLSFNDDLFSFSIKHKYSFYYDYTDCNIIDLNK